MDVEEVRLLQIEGQIHALAQAWLYLAAAMEMRGEIDPEVLAHSMLNANWQGAPLEPHAQRMMQHLVELLAAARENRKRKDRYQSTGLDE